MLLVRVQCNICYRGGRGITDSFQVIVVFIRNPMNYDMEEEAFILLESLACSIKSSMQHDIEEDEEAHIPFNSLLMYIRNPMKGVMEEEAFILLESLLLSFRHAMHNAIDIEEEGNISLASVLLSNGNGKGTPSFHSIPYCCLSGIQFVRIIILFKTSSPDCSPMTMEVGGLHPIKFLIVGYNKFHAACYRCYIMSMAKVHQHHIQFLIVVY
jgi:hypothetical protein